MLYIVYFLHPSVVDPYKALTVRYLHSTHASGVHILLRMYMSHLVIRIIPWTYQIFAQYGVFRPMP